MTTRTVLFRAEAYNTDIFTAQTSFPATNNGKFIVSALFVIGNLTTHIMYMLVHYISLAHAANSTGLSPTMPRGRAITAVEAEIYRECRGRGALREQIIGIVEHERFPELLLPVQDIHMDARAHDGQRASQQWRTGMGRLRSIRRRFP